MPAAARIGDPSDHGGGLLPRPALPDVLIGGLPAAHQADVHACPVLIPGHASVSVFVSASTSVRINGKAALRAGDTAGCGAALVGGDPTVQIG